MQGTGGALLKPRAEPLTLIIGLCTRGICCWAWIALISVRITSCHRYPLFVLPTLWSPPLPLQYTAWYIHTQTQVRPSKGAKPARETRHGPAVFIQERKDIHVIEYQCARVSLSCLRSGHVTQRFRWETVAGKSAVSCHFSNIIKYGSAWASWLVLHIQYYQYSQSSHAVSVSHSRNTCSYTMHIYVLLPFAKFTHASIVEPYHRLSKFTTKMIWRLNC